MWCAQILVFCCAHAAQVQEHLEAGPWLKPGALCKVGDVCASHQSYTACQLA